MSAVEIEEGIYMIWNAYNGECLDLSNGKWEYGQVRRLSTAIIAKRAWTSDALRYKHGSHLTNRESSFTTSAG